MQDGSPSVREQRPLVSNGRLRLFLTSACNLACFYCHNEGQPKGFDYVDDGLVTRLLAQTSGGEIRKVIFSGGEPLIHPQVIEYVEAFSLRVSETSLITNGLLLDKSMAIALRGAGLHKIRLGVDSFRRTKPRPSPGYLDKEFSFEETVANVLEAGLRLDLNVVLTKFNQAEVPRFLEFAIANELDIKFFEHLEVRPPAPGALINTMVPKPQVSEEHFMGMLGATLGNLPDFELVDEFAPATSAARVAHTEIRYCRYLCTFGRCASPGTRVDAEGFVYTCMSNRGLDIIEPGMTDAEVDAVFRSASGRRCGAQ